MNTAEKITDFKKALPKNVKLVAVSKTKPEEEILQAYHTGHKIFGENKVQELRAKYESLPKDIEWHYIGHLQRNKVKYIAPFVSMIHAVDSMRLLRKINNEAKKAKREIQVLLQMHIAKEQTKFGLSETELYEIIESPEIEEFKNLKICGLMAMATFTDNKEQIESEFDYIKNLFDELKENHFSESDDFAELSIGMSNDYEIALQKGASIVRIGSKIFGERNY